jgi:hypothetical protein
MRRLLSDDAATYANVHNRLLRHRGPAYLQSCYMCGGPARNWACMRITTLALDPIRGITGFSNDLLEDYVPMCASHASVSDVWVWSQYQREIGNA